MRFKEFRAGQIVDYFDKGYRVVGKSPGGSEDPLRQKTRMHCPRNLLAKLPGCNIVELASIKQPGLHRINMWDGDEFTWIRLIEDVPVPK